MKTDYIFQTYNELNKQFEVHVVLVGKEYQFKLVKKLDGDKPPKHPGKHRKSKFDIVLERLDNLEKIVVQDHNLLIETNQLLHKVIKLNNLKTK